MLQSSSVMMLIYILSGDVVMSEPFNDYEVTLYNDEIILITEPVDLWRGIGPSDAISPWPVRARHYGSITGGGSTPDFDFSVGLGHESTIWGYTNDEYPRPDLIHNILEVPEFNNIDLANVAVLHCKRDFLKLYVGYAHVIDKSRLIFYFENGILPYPSILYIRVLPKGTAHDRHMTREVVTDR